MKLDPNERSDNVEDYRGRTGGGGGGRGGGFRFGIGTLVILAIGYFLGFDPRLIMGLLQGVQSVTPEASAPMEPAPAGSDAPRADDPQAVFVSAVLRDTEKTWGEIFRAGGAQYQNPKLVLFSDQVSSGCGAASASSGPFYCPADQKLYIDLNFYRQLDTEFGAPGDFAQAYVLAHEVGHHVQTLLGTSARVRQAQERVSEAEGSKYQVAMELQADCYAGIWAYHSNQERSTLEPGDIEEGLRAASSVGDDTIQKRMQGYVVPESFTHGSAQQRVSWFKRGFETGSLKACDTFGSER
jgi:predicted metalloprotease